MKVQRRRFPSAPPARAAEARRATRSAAGALNGSRPARSNGQADRIRLLCVDDHPVLVEGLKAQFAVDGGIEVVGRLASAERLLKEVERLRPDAVVLDIEMPGPDAFEVADRLRQAYPNVRVMVLSAHIRDTFISASFKAGVAAYFAKSDELDDIVAGIRAVARSRQGAFVLGPKARERCRPVHARALARAAAFTTPPAAPPAAFSGSPETLLDSLTNREAEVLRLIGKGLSRTQIAAELCRSAKTVDGHQERMMKKLGITARADLMRFAIREGLAQA